MFCTRRILEQRGQARQLILGSLPRAGFALSVMEVARHYGRWEMKGFAWTISTLLCASSLLSPQRGEAAFGLRCLWMLIVWNNWRKRIRWWLNRLSRRWLTTKVLDKAKFELLTNNGYSFTLLNIRIYGIGFDLFYDKGSSEWFLYIYFRSKYCRIPAFWDVKTHNLAQKDAWTRK